MKQKYFEIGNRLTTGLGLENKTVICTKLSREKNEIFSIK